jgi:hypothetical protein
MTSTGDQDRNSSMMMLASDGSTWVSVGAVPWGPRARNSRPSTLGAKANSRTRPSSIRSIRGEAVGVGSGLRAGRWPPVSGGPVGYCQPGGMVWGGAPAHGGEVGGGGPPAGGSTGVHPQGCWAGGGGGSVGSATRLLADVGNPSVPQATWFTVWQRLVHDPARSR